MTREQVVSGQVVSCVHSFQAERSDTEGTEKALEGEPSRGDVATYVRTFLLL